MTNLLKSDFLSIHLVSLCRLHITHVASHRQSCCAAIIKHFLIRNVDFQFHLLTSLSLDNSLIVELEGYAAPCLLNSHTFTGSQSLKIKEQGILIKLIDYNFKDCRLRE